MSIGQPGYFMNDNNQVLKKMNEVVNGFKVNFFVNVGPNLTSSIKNK